jgi:preprotein translocase subunit SecD
MTIVASPTEKPNVDEAQLLFQEAKQRRRRRWLISGIVALVVVVLLGVTVSFTAGRGGRGSLKPAAPASITGAVHSVANLSLRPVLCYAPPLTLATGQTASTGPLPTCASSSVATATNLHVTPDSVNVNGYTSNSNIPEDAQYATYPSTSPTNDDEHDMVLLPGTSAAGSGRYVLGPAGLTGTAVKSASAQMNYGQWTVRIVLTTGGSAQWDALAKEQFHAIVGVDLNGQVISAPITQPTQSFFSSFNGQLQISGSFTEQQAKVLAAQLR